MTTDPHGEPLPWQQVPIAECGEPLERVIPGDRLLVDPIYRRLGYPEALDRVFLRTGVIDRLRAAAQALPDGFAIQVWDGWRPVSLQSRLYNDYKAELVDSSSLDGAELEDLVAKFVSMPSSDPTHPSPHLTGGAVDLTLTDLTGTPLDMGSSFDELTERSYTDYYGTTSDNSHTIFRERREMLLAVMHGVGFTNFESEWWHFDYGDQFWAEAMSRSAVYGKVSPV